MDGPADKTHTASYIMVYIAQIVSENTEIQYELKPRLQFSQVSKSTYRTIEMK